MRPRHPDRGLLLFEVCLALALMTIGIVWMLRSFSQTMLAAERTRDAGAAAAALDEQTLYLRVRDGLPARGASGLSADGQWRWRAETTPLAATTSHLLQTRVTVERATQAPASTLTTATWLPVTE